MTHIGFINILYHLAVVMRFVQTYINHTLPLPLLIFTVLGIVPPVLSQTFSPEALVCDVIGIEEGLSQGLVRGITQDTLGYMWFTSTDGINRFDGFEMKGYKEALGSEVGLIDKYCTSVIRDSRGLIWVTTQKGGAHLYDYLSNAFYPIAFHHDVKPDFKIGGDLIEDHHGNIWFIDTKSGALLFIDCSELDSKTSILTSAKKLIAVPAQNFFDGFPERLLGSHPQIIAFDQIWSLKDNIIERIVLNYETKSAKKLSPVSLPQKKEEDRITNFNLALNSNCDDAAYINSEFLYRLNIKTGEPLDSIRLAENLLKNFRLVYGNDEKIYSISKNAEITIFNFADKTSKSYCLKGETGEILRGAFTLFWDSQNNLWIGTSGFGVFKHHRFQKRFHNYPANENLYVKDLIKISESGFVINSEQTIDWRDNAYNLQKENPLTKIREKLSLPKLEVLCADEKQYIWLFSNDNQNNHSSETKLVRCVQKMGKWEIDRVVNSLHHTITKGLVSQNGTLYFDCSKSGTKKRGIGRLKLDEDIIEFFPFSDPQNLIRWAPSSFFETNDGNIWTTSKEGVFEFVQDKEQFEMLSFPNTNNQNKISNHTTAFQIKEDPHNQEALWLATTSGLAKYNKADDSWQFYTVDEGLANNTIYALEFDKEGNIWLSSNYGISYYNRISNKFRNFGKSHGLKCHEYNHSASLKLGNDLLLFGGVDGITSFSPSHFAGDTMASKTIITGLQLFNNEIEVQTASEAAQDLHTFTLQMPLSLSKKLTLSYDQSLFSISFSCIDFTLPQHNAYEYKLEGFNNNWIAAKKLHQATFTNLNPGNYIFKVRSSNSNSVWSEPTSLAITILPPWWQTIWFRMLILISVAVLVYGFIQYRLKKLQEIKAVRDGIARDLHDEIGSTMSSISLYSAVLERKLSSSDPSTKSLVQKITISSTSVMESMNDIVWALNSELNNIQNMLSRMRAFSSEILEPINCAFVFDLDPKLVDQKLSMVERRNIYLIFKEAVNNTAKYAQATELKTSIRIHGQKLEVIIADNGKGFLINDSVNETNLGGNGLNNMKKRAEELNADFSIKSIENVGTTVSLILRLKR